MKRGREYTLQEQPTKKKFKTTYRRPAYRPTYQNLVVARPRQMAPLATRGYAFGSKEKKAFSRNSAAYEVNTGGSFTLLNVPVPGTGFNERVGRKIYNKSLYIRGKVYLENARVLLAATNAFAQLARLIVFIDFQPNGVTPAVTDLLVEANSNSQLNLDNRDRFRILKDKQYAFDPLVITASSAVISFNHTISAVKCFKKLNFETIFNGVGGGTIGDITSGALYMFWIGDVAAAVGTDCVASVTTRVRYDDA